MGKVTALILEVVFYCFCVVAISPSKFDGEHRTFVSDSVAMLGSRTYHEIGYFTDG